MSLGCGPSLNTHTHCGSGFDPSSPVPTKSLTDYLVFNQDVSLAGSIYNALLEDDLLIEQNFSDFFGETIADPISFTQQIAKELCIDRPLTEALGITDSFVYSGTADAPVTGGGGSTPISAIFDSTTLQGMVVYVPSDGHAELAQSDAVSTSGAIGLAEFDVTATNTGTYLTEGQISRNDWTSITGATSLTPGAVYFLSTSLAGGMSTTPPSTVGETIVRIGRAASLTVLDIEISQPVLL